MTVILEGVMTDRGERKYEPDADRRRHGKACLAGSAGLLWMVAGCTNQERDRLQGYVEGEFVYIAAPFAGALESLQVQRGAQVHVGGPIVLVDSTSEKSVRDEAERRLAQARATWEDVKKGKRPSEIEALQAQLKQARAASTLAEREFKRQQGLMGVPGATVELDFDRARSTRDQTRQRVAEVEAELRTAQLGSRSDQVIAAGAEVRAGRPRWPRRIGSCPKSAKRPPRPAWCSTRCIARGNGSLPAGRSSFCCPH